MSIVQNLKLLNKPINELAMLPQETIIQMAQTGQIPTAFVAPILGEKAEQAKAGANAAAMMAQQQMPPTTVLEGIIAQNAANQAVESMPAMPPMGQQMPMEMPEDSGIAALPVSEDMVPEFAGGGIVAFKAGDLVDGFDYNAATRSIDAAGGVDSLDYSQFGDVGEELRRQEALRRMYLGDNDAVRTELGGMEAAAQQQRAMRLLEAGLGIMGGESPYALSNIAKGAQPALKGYGEDVAAQRKRKVELAGMERAEKAGVLDVAQRRAAEQRALTSREKQADLDRKNRLAVANLPPDVVRGARAIMMPGEKLEDALSRYANITSTKDQYNAASGLVRSAFDAASKRFADSIGGSGGNYDLSRAAGGDKKAQKQLGMTKEQAETELTRIRGEYLKEAYRDIGMSPETANQYLRAPRSGAAKDGDSSKPEPVAPPQDAINALKNDNTPLRRKQFDEIFGPGAADRVLPLAKAQ